MRIAEINPSHCSVCFNQDPQSLHVDMDAATDGPVLRTADGNPIVMDDIVICETCIRRASDLLPEYVELRNQVIAAQRDAMKAWDYAEALKKSMAAMQQASAIEVPKPDTLPPPRRRRPVGA